MLVPFSPLLVALSANSPISNGQFSDNDHQWEAFAEATDSRTEREADTKLRFSAAQRYVSNHEYVQFFHNDQGGKVRECGTSRGLLDSVIVADERLSAYVAS